MRVAIICATYEPGASYQENIWAEQLTKAGHVSRLFYPGKNDGAIEKKFLPVDTNCNRSERPRCRAGVSGHRA